MIDARASWIVRTFAAASLCATGTGCPDRTADDSKSPEKPEPVAAGSQPASEAAETDPHGGSTKPPFEVPDVAPLPPLEGEPVEGPARWTAPSEPEECSYRMREVFNESMSARLVAGHELVVTYDVTARRGPGRATTYEAVVTHVRARGRREDYNLKLDSARPGDRVRIEGGADTTVMPEVVVPFALLGHPIEVTVAPDGAVEKVSGGDAVRKRMMALHPPKPRESPHYQARTETLLDDARLAAYLLPMAGIKPTPKPITGTRDDADYAAQVLTNARVRPAGATYLWEEKQVFAPADEGSEVPAKAGAPTVELVNGKRSTTVEQEPGRACFRQAGREETRVQKWTGIVDEEEAVVEQQKALTRLWVRGTMST